MNALKRYERVTVDLDRLAREAQSGQKRRVALADKITAEHVARVLRDCRRELRLLRFDLEDSVAPCSVIETDAHTASREELESAGAMFDALASKGGAR